MLSSFDGMSPQEIITLSDSSNWKLEDNDILN